MNLNPDTQSIDKTPLSESVASGGGVTTQDLAIKPDATPETVGTSSFDEVMQEHLSNAAVSGEASSFDEVMAEHNKLNPPKVDPLANSKIAAQTIDLKDNQNQNAVAEKHNVSTDAAAAMIRNSNVNDLLSEPALKDIHQDYPIVSDWAKTPANYKLLQQDPDWAKKVEMHSETLSEPLKWSSRDNDLNDFIDKSKGFFEDVSTAWDHNVNTAELINLHSQLAMGTLTPEAALPRLEKAQLALDSHPLVNYKSELNKLNESSTALTNKINHAYDVIMNDKLSANEHKTGWVSRDNDVTALKDVPGALLGYLSDRLLHPAAFALQLGSGAAVMAPGIVGGLGGEAVGGPLALTGALVAGASLPIAAAVGTLGAIGGATIGGYGGGAYGFYGMSMIEQQERFRDHNTGKIDFKKMLADEKALSEMRATATKYAGVHGIFSAVSALTAGKLTSMAMEQEKANIAAGIIGSTNNSLVSNVGAFASDVAGQTALSGAAETTARLATGETVPKSITSGVEMATAGLGLTPLHVGAQAAKRYYFNMKAQSEFKAEVTKEFKNLVAKLVEDKNNAEEAIKNKATLDAARENKDKSGVPKEYPQQSSELVNSNNNYHQFNMREFEDFAIKANRPAIEIATELGPNALEAYQKAKQGNHSSFNIDDGDYYRYSNNLPELDNISHVNGSELNSDQAKETIKDVYKGEAKIYSETVKTKGATGEAEGTVHYPDINDGPTQGDPVLRSIKLMQMSRSPEDQQVYRDYRNQIGQSTPDLSPEVADASAELMYQHTVFRANNLGRNLQEVAKELRIGYQEKIKAKKGYVTSGQFQHGETNQFNEPRDSVIFSRASTPKTIIHEFGHAWLHHLAVDHEFINGLTDRTPQQQEYKEAMDSAAKILGLDNMGELYKQSREHQTALHETFAQTAEKYFHEGEVPSNAVTKAFGLMKKWLASVAHTIGKSYPQFPPITPTDEIARMFQTIVGGSNAVEAQTQQMPGPMFPPEVMGPRNEAYMKLHADARDEVMGELYAKFMNKSFKEREAAISKAETDLYNQAKETVRNLPSIKLMEAILSGGDEFKITHQSVLEVLAGGDKAKMKEIQDFTPKKIIAGQKKVGTDVRIIMRDMGITDPNQMVDMLREMGDRHTMVDKLHDKLIEDHFPILKSDEVMHEEAQQAISQIGKSKILYMELEKLMELNPKLLQKMSGTIALPAGKMAAKAMEQIKVIGKDMANKALQAKLNPKDFLKAANNSGEQAAKFLAKADYEAAYHAKMDEAQNNVAYHEAIQAQKKIVSTKSALARVMNMEGRDVGRNYNPDIFEQAQGIAHAMDNNAPLMEIDPELSSSIMDNNRRDVINQMIRDVNASNNGKSTNKMTVEDYNKVGDILKAITSAAAKAKVVETADGKLNLENLVQETVSDMGVVKPSDPKTGNSIKDGIQNLVTAVLLPRTVVAGMMSEESWARSKIRSIFSGIDLAQAFFSTKKNADAVILDEAIRKFIKDSPELQNLMSPLTKQVSKITGVDTSKPIPAPEINHTFKNQGEIVQALLYWGSESGREKLIMGGTKQTGRLGAYNPDTQRYESPALEKMFENMMKDGRITKAHTDFAKVVWSLYAAHYEASKEAVRKVYGYNIGEVKGRSFKGVDGEDITGGYVPLARDAEFEEIRNVPRFSVDNSGTGVKDFFPPADTSHTKSRENGYYPLDMDLTNLRRHLNNVYKVAYLMPTMFEAGKVFDHPAFETAMEARRPGMHKNVLLPWFNSTMAQTYSTEGSSAAMKTLYRTSSFLKNNGRLVQLALKITTMSKHLTHIAAANEFIDAGHLRTAALDVGMNINKAREEISAADPRMAVRWDDKGGLIRERGDYEDLHLTHTPESGIGDKVAKKLVYDPLQYLQRYSDMVVYKAAVEQAKVKFGMTDQEQILSYASEAVYRSQLSTEVSNRAAALKTNPVGKNFTDYMAVPVLDFGLIHESQMRNLSESKATRVRTLAASLFRIAIIPMMGTALTSGGIYRVASGNRTKKEENFGSDKLKDGVASVLSIMAPIIGPQIQSYVSKGELNAPVLTTGKSIGKTYQYLKNNALATAFPGTYNPQELTADTLMTMLDAATLVTGQPVSLIHSAYKDLIDLFPELEDKTSKHK